MSAASRGATAVLAALRAAALPAELVVAFSGGPDSTALARGLVELGLTPTLAHLDHGLHAASEAEAAHARAAAFRWGLPLAQRRLAAGALDGSEASAREARYAYLAEVAAGRPLLTAHTRDDQAETLLLRLARGTGARGLAGMPASRPLGAGQLLRPLLGVARAELQSALVAWGEQSFSDPSNRDPRFARNRLRSGLLPRLGAPLLARLAAAASGAARLRARAEPWAAATLARLTRPDNGRDLLGLPASAVHGPGARLLDRAALRALAPELLAWVLQAAGVSLDRAHLARLPAALARGAPGCSLGWPTTGPAAWLERRWLAIGAPPQPLLALTPAPLTPGSSAVLAHGLQLRLLPGPPPPGAPGLRPQSQPLTLRSPRPGDRLRLPAGSKPLRRLLTDIGAPRHLRSGWPLLATPDGTVLWAYRLGVAAPARGRELHLQITPAP